MMRKKFLPLGIAVLTALGVMSCTERRRATTPVPDGDTIEVVVNQKFDDSKPKRIIEADSDDEIYGSLPDNPSGIKR